MVTVRRGGVAAIVGVVVAVLVAVSCQVNQPTATVLSAGATSVAVGTPVTLTARVSPAVAGVTGVPAGSVTFLDGAVALGAATLANGVAVFTTSTLNVGTHQLTASYSGGSGWWGSPSDPLSVTVTSSGPRYYLSLGDSLSTGTGVPSGQGYVDLVLAHQQARVANLSAVRLGCGGATTTSVINGGGCTYAQGSQLAAAEAFLTAHPGQVAFVTISIGGNDATPCFVGGTVDQTCSQQHSATAKANLATILSRLRTAGGPVPIVGHTLYDPFLAAWVAGNTTGAQQSQQALVGFNAALVSTYQASGALVGDVAGAFDTNNFALTGSWAGTTVPQNVANICNWTLMCPGANIHPNATGYQVIATTLDAVIDPVVTR